jgi:colanic acid biosynthesis glycosyl transferase WcaI
MYEGLPLGSIEAKYPFKVRRAFTFHPHRGSLLVRALREQLMASGLLAYATSLPADIVLVSSPSMFLGPIGLLLARAKRAKFVWDIRDITWGYARDQLNAATSIMEFVGAVLERYMLFVARRADLVVGASPGITQTLVKAGVSPSRATTVFNGISSDLLEELVQSTGPTLHKPRPIVTYAGSIGYNQALAIMLDVARMLPDVDFVMAGDGPELPSLVSQAEKLSLTNVSFPGFLDRQELLELYGKSDILLGHVKDAPVINATMIPVKLFEYMATGKPVIYAGRGIASEFLNGIGCAATVPPEDPTVLTEAILSLLRDPKRMEALGRAGQTFVKQNFRREVLMEELADTLKERFGTYAAPDDMG